MLNDLRFALRSFRRSPVFAASAIACLALGIGANTAIFSLLDQVLLRSLPVADPERLVLFHTGGQDMGRSMSDNQTAAVFSYPMYRDLRDRSRAFSGVISRASAPVSVAGPSATTRGTAEMVSGNLFEVLSVRAAIGRTLTKDDDMTPGAHPVIVLSYGYWMREFGGDPAILNRKLVVNGYPMTVVGVADGRFHGVLSGQTPDLYVPIAMKRQITPGWYGLDDRQTRWLNILARLKPGLSPERAQAGADSVWRSVRADELATFPHMPERLQHEYLSRRLELHAASQGINELKESWRSPLLVVMAMVALVLLIACANVANLLMARAAGRRREVAIRLSIGARRAAILRQLLAESMLLSAAGGLAGLVLARWTAAGLLRLMPEDVAGNWLLAAIDARVLCFTVLVAAATGLVFGCAPLALFHGIELGPALKDQGSGAGSGLKQTRFRRGVVAAQVALALVLMIGAGLFARSIVNLMNTDPGFRPQNLLTFSVDPQLNGYDHAREVVFFRELQGRLSRVPGVESSGSAAMGPFGEGGRGANVTIEGYRARDDDEARSQWDTVSPWYFRTLGIPVVAGREFSDRDDAASSKAVVVNDAFSKKYFGDRNPVGSHMTFGGGNVLDREIVGVVRENRQGDLRHPPGPFVFVPYPQDKDLGRMTFYVRSYRGDAELAREVRSLVREMDGNLPVYNVKSMSVRIGQSLYTDRLIATLATAFGVLATLLAAVGLYGVIAYTVARRTAEIGIRVALGAVPRDVVWLVMREVLLVAGGGIAIGLPAALALGRVVESQLFGIHANDPAVFAAAALALAAAATLAGYVPARRALAIDPMRALRYE
jgi:predicted permease